MLPWVLMTALLAAAALPIRPSLERVGAQGQVCLGSSWSGEDGAAVASRARRDTTTACVAAPAPARPALACTPAAKADAEPALPISRPRALVGRGPPA